MPNPQNPFRALALSLLPDPFYQAISVDFAASAEQRLKVLEDYFAYSLGEAQRTGCSVSAAQVQDGCAAWLLPRTAEVQAREASAKAAFIAQILGPLGSANYDAIVDFMTPLAGRHVPDDAWYLSILGVHPAAQGRGLGEELLRPTLQDASARGVSCYLETFAPRSVGFYTRLGFKEVARYDEPTTGAPYIIMLRDG